MVSERSSKSGIRKIERAKLDSRNRLIVPSEITEEMAWFDRSRAFDCLLRFDEPGRICLLSPEVLARLRDVEAQLLELPDGDDKWDQSLLLGIRFQPVTFEKDSRLTLTKEAIVHLKIANELPEEMWVVRRGAQMVVWNDLFRNESIARSRKMFRGVVD